MMTGRDEALDIFRKWSDERISIRVQSSFPLFAFGLWGRIISLNSEEIRVADFETQSEIVVKLVPELEYGYGDNRNIFGEEKKFSESILVFFPSKSPNIDFNYVAFAALEGS